MDLFSVISCSLRVKGYHVRYTAQSYYAGTIVCIPNESNAASHHEDDDNHISNDESNADAIRWRSKPAMGWMWVYKVHLFDY